MDAFDTKSIQIASPIFSDENLVKSCNGFVQREHLSEIVNLGNHGRLVDFAWGSKMIAEKISLDALKLKEQNKSFPIPVTLQVEEYFFLLVFQVHSYCFLCFIKCYRILESWVKCRNADR